MALGNKRRWIRYEQRTREPGDSPTVRSNYVAGAYSRVPPAVPQNVSAAGSLASVVFKWSHVEEDAAGKPLQALARYIVYYKRYVGTAPNIDIDSPSTYDEAIVVDNNTLSIAAGRLYNASTGQWEDEYIAARIAAVDRSGRRGQGSAQVQGKAAASRVANIIAMGIIETPGGSTENDKKFTKVWDNISVSVPSGYRYIVVVHPWVALDTSFNEQPADIIFYSTHNIFGLFEKPGYAKSYLEAGTHHNVDLKIYHYTNGLFASYCTSGQTAEVPQIAYDFNSPGVLQLDHIEEGEYVTASEFLVLKFDPVIWFVYRVPL